MPQEVSHFVIWSRVPAISSANIPLGLQERVKEDGLWGFTGTEGGDEPILPSGIVPRPPTTDIEEKLLDKARHEFDVFVKGQWSEDTWECAWFVNPPVCYSISRDRLLTNASQRLQSVPGLAHIHVFARRK